MAKGKKLTLPSGRQAVLRIYHTQTEEKQPRRCTEVELTVDDDSPSRGTFKFKVQSVCSHTDNFCKSLGRKFAAMKLLQKVTSAACERGKSKNWFLPKSDRRAVFATICPELRQKS